MDKQIKVGDFNASKSDHDNENVKDNMSIIEDAKPDYDLHSEANPDLSDAVTLEKRRAHKLEIQVCFYIIF